MRSTYLACFVLSFAALIGCSDTQSDDGGGNAGIGGECSSDGDCAEGLACEGGSCTQGCAEDFDCDLGFTCIDQRCQGAIPNNK